jgi:methylglyoxal synthase
MARRLRIALVAHDARKDALIAWARRWEGWLADHELCGTGTTSGEIERACPRLRVEALLSGPKGGDMQIGARIAEGGWTRWSSCRPRAPPTRTRPTSRR